MKPEHTVRIQDLVGLIHKLFPPVLAEDWDNVGLQVGDPGAPVERVLVCLDPTETVFDTAVNVGAQALVSHHPLIFRPLKKLIPRDETSKVLFRAVREDVAVISAHTNLDRAGDGLNDWLAARLELNDAQPLESEAEGGLLKLVVFVPMGHASQVADALYAAGAGHIGRYDQCSFRVEGTGTFRAGPGTRPFIGAQGVTEQVREIRLETILPQELVDKAVPRMLKAHPYEEVAYDLLPLRNRRPGIGLGRIGRLTDPATLGEFAARVKTALRIPHLRLVGDPAQTIAKVAVCGGSGSSLLHEAARQGAEVLVTGDVKYHEARTAQSLGLALLDAGHFGTEQLMVRELAVRLRSAAEARKMNLSIIETEGESDPFQTI